MSVLVAGLCYDIAFGCPKRKAVAVALADHASHDGTNVRPSIALIARKVEWSERTVQRALRDLEAIGLLTVVREGGNGPKATREWAFDMHLLRDLATGTHQIVADEKGDSETPSEGDRQTPFKVVRVSDRTLRVSETTPKGDTADTRTITNHQEPSARERAGATKSAPAPRTMRLTETDVSWGAWLSEMEARGSPAMRAAAVKAGEIFVEDRWPDQNKPLPQIVGWRAAA